MTTSEQASVDDLRRESERTRAQLAQTVDMLRDKVSNTASEIKVMVSPSHIKDEIKTYVREERENLIQSVQRKARENPLQAAAVGAAIMYPALSLVRAIPMPLLLIGAGLFLTSSRGKQTIETVAGKAGEAYQAGASAAGDTIDRARSRLGEAADGVRSGLGEATGATAHAASSFVDAVSETAAAAASTVTGTTTGLKDAARETASNTIGQAATVAAASGNSIAEFVERNPLVVAGIGALIGAFVAGALPGSDAENRLFGPPKAKLKDKALEAVNQGIEKAKSVASEMADEVAAAAAQEGLDANGIARAVDTAVAGAKSVVDKGVATALARDESDRQDSQQH